MFLGTSKKEMGPQRWHRGKESTCQCRRYRRHGFDHWVGMNPWRRKWQPTPVFLPGKSHGQRSLASYSPGGHTESATTEWLSKTHTKKTWAISDTTESNWKHTSTDWNRSSLPEILTPEKLFNRDVNSRKKIGLRRSVHYRQSPPWRSPERHNCRALWAAPMLISHSSTSQLRAQRNGWYH